MGASEAVDTHIGRETEVVDGLGAFVMPGLLDSHCHAVEAARADLYEVRLSGTDGLDDVIRSVGDALTRLAGKGWLKGAGWSIRLIDQMRLPGALAALDQVTADRPMVLRDSSHHAMFANSAALRIADVSAADVKGGLVDRRADGSLSGLLFEDACGLIDRAIPLDEDAVRRRSALHAVSTYNSFGVTGFVQAATTEMTMKLFSDLDREGSLSAWVATCIATDTILTPEREGIGAETIARRNTYRSHHVVVDFVKFFMDGVPGARTASFLSPYALREGVGAEPAPFHSAEALSRLIQPLDANGIHVKVHAVGDRAIRETLDAIASVRHQNGGGGPQHSIAHLSYISDADIPRLRELDVAADLCPPLWFPNAILQANAVALGNERADRAWPIGDILRSGATAVLGTDWPIVSSPNPWPGLAALVTREDPSRCVSGVFRPDQALTLQQALRLCTCNVAAYMGIGDRTGSIACGKSADFAFLDRNLLEVRPQDIADTRVSKTYFGGRLVYSR
ncbi:amidohydrolase [Tianweitania sp. Rool2]|uniref:Amidohydrolase n=1 Tax=Oryzicola mucosus TaxID=2767425 RepID=A0A8J6PN54_9HYPH|nr:amidohydrolase [Oryzicola mucosus]